MLVMEASDLLVHLEFRDGQVYVTGNTKSSGALMGGGRSKKGFFFCVCAVLLNVHFLIFHFCFCFFYCEPDSGLSIQSQCIKSRTIGVPALLDSGLFL